MGVQFDVYDPDADNFAAPTVDMSFATGMRLGDLLGLTFVTSESAEGECTLAELRTGLSRWPDGHRDPLINQRMGELTRLLLAAERRNPDLRVTWC